MLLDFFVHPWYEPAGSEGRTVGGFGADHLSVWIHPKGEPGVTRVDLGPAAAVQAAVEDALGALVEAGERGFAVPDVAADELPALGESNDALRRLLWEPIEEHLGNATVALVSPDSFLGTLPFEVLRREDRSYLIEHHAFVYVQDAASVVDAGADRESEGAAPRLLTVGAVDYVARGGAGEKGRDRDAAEDLLAMADVTRGFAGTWTDLPATGAESRAVADLHARAHGSEATCVVLRGSEATEERLKAELPHFDVVHLATHGFFQPDGITSRWSRAQVRGEAPALPSAEQRRVTGLLPGFLSGVVCAGASAPPDPDRDDGLLTAEELSWLDLSEVDLVVLSACETGLGEPTAGEGMIGLRRAVRQAGASTVVCSLWQVSDEATSALVQRFFERRWVEGDSALEALRGAQLEMLRENRERDGESRPHTWGAFVLDGDWD